MSIFKASSPSTQDLNQDLDQIERVIQFNPLIYYFTQNSSIRVPEKATVSVSLQKDFTLDPGKSSSPSLVATPGYYIFEWRFSVTTEATSSQSVAYFFIYRLGTDQELLVTSSTSLDTSIYSSSSSGYSDRLWAFTTPISLMRWSLRFKATIPFSDLYFGIWNNVSSSVAFTITPQPSFNSLILFKL
jgi:hypothetical protein